MSLLVPGIYFNDFKSLFLLIIEFGKIKVVIVEIQIEFSLLKGWCEILIRRPSGEISWMCQIRSGQLTSNSFSLADISAILFPHTQVITKAKVNIFIKTV